MNHKFFLVVCGLFLALSGRANAVSLISLTEEIEALSAQMENDSPTVFVECQLRYALGCEDLKDAFFAQLPSLTRQDNENALIHVLLTDEHTPEGIIVHSQWTSAPSLELVGFALPLLLLPPQYDRARRMSELITLLSQGVLLHIRVKSGSGLEQVIEASLADQPRPPSKTDGPFYLDISLDGSASQSGIGSHDASGGSGLKSSNTSASGSTTLNWSADRYRILVNGDLQSQKQSLPGENGSTLEVKNNSQSFSVLAVYSLTKNKKWNVAIIQSWSANPVSNLKLGKTTYFGAEYTLVPFRIDQSYEFRVRSGVTHFNDRLVLPNDRGNTDESYYSLPVQLYAYWLILKK